MSVCLCVCVCVSVCLSVCLSVCVCVSPPLIYISPSELQVRSARWHHANRLLTRVWSGWLRVRDTTSLKTGCPFPSLPSLAAACGSEKRVPRPTEACRLTPPLHPAAEGPRCLEGELMHMYMNLHVYTCYIHTSCTCGMHVHMNHEVFLCPPPPWQVFHGQAVEASARNRAAMQLRSVWLGRRALRQWVWSVRQLRVWRERVEAAGRLWRNNTLTKVC